MTVDSSIYQYSNRLTDRPTIISRQKGHMLLVGDNYDLQAGQIAFSPKTDTFVLGFNNEVVMSLDAACCEQVVMQDPVTGEVTFTNPDTGDVIVLCTDCEYPLVYDPVTSQLTYQDNDGNTALIATIPTTFVYDQPSGQVTYIDPVTGDSVPLVSSEHPFNYDPVTGQLTYVDPVSGDTVPIATIPAILSYDQPSGQVTYNDPLTGDAVPLVSSDHPLNYDPVTGQLTYVDPVSGDVVPVATVPAIFSYDQPSGQVTYIDPVTGDSIPLVSSDHPLNYDPVTGQLTYVDPVSGDVVPVATVPAILSYDQPSGQVTYVDPVTGDSVPLVSSDHPLNYDPVTGQLTYVDPVSGDVVAVATVPAIFSYDQPSGQVTYIDPVTGDSVPLVSSDHPLNYDPVTGQLTYVDPVSGDVVPVATVPAILSYDQPSGQVTYVDPVTGDSVPLVSDDLPFTYDPVTGQLTYVDPVSGDTVPIATIPAIFTYDQPSGQVTYNDPITGDAVPLVSSDHPLDYDPVTGILMYDDGMGNVTTIATIPTTFVYDDVAQQLTYVDPVSGDNLPLVSKLGMGDPSTFTAPENTLFISTVDNHCLWLHHGGQNILVGDPSQLSYNGGVDYNDVHSGILKPKEIWFGDNIISETDRNNGPNGDKVWRSNIPFYNADGQRNTPMASLLGDELPFHSTQLENAGIVHPVNMNGAVMNDMLVNPLGRYWFTNDVTHLFPTADITIAWPNNRAHSFGINLPARASANPHIVVRLFQFINNPAVTWYFGIQARTMGMDSLDVNGLFASCMVVVRVRAVGGVLSFDRIYMPRDTGNFFISYPLWPHTTIPISGSAATPSLLSFAISSNGIHRVVIGTPDIPLFTNPDLTNDPDGIDATQPYADFRGTFYNDAIKNAKTNDMLRFVGFSETNSVGYGLAIQEISVFPEHQGRLNSF